MSGSSAVLHLDPVCDFPARHANTLRTDQAPRLAGCSLPLPESDKQRSFQIDRSDILFISHRHCR